MEKRYDHAQHEQAIYNLWEETQSFAPESQVVTDTKNSKKGNQDRSARSGFSIIMPPPNANDPLHIGHAMFVALEDTMIRFHRLLGEPTVWIPGTDHAGIETQYVFEKKLQKQGKSRFNFDRETLFKMIWDYVQENSNTAVDQIKRLGASADWSRFKFTLDTNVVEFVLDTFKRLHQDGLIYRDLSLVNYCTKCGTSYSELEVKHVEMNDPLYYIQYGPFVLATVRPETKFGDTAVAVHPDDKRYQQYIGQQITIDGLNGPFTLTVIADEYVDPEFGTGVVKITPAHDPNDFQVGKRHNLEIKQVISTNGKLNHLAGAYEGLSVTEARKKVVADLQAKNLITKVDEKYMHTVGTCYKCGRVIEPLPLPQFFIKVNDSQKSLTQAALKALDTNETIIHGAGREKILRHWLENLKDWNISRQVVWGIRIPVWYEVDGYEDQIQVSFVDQGGQYKQGLLAELLQTFSFEEILTGLQQAFPSKTVPYSVSLDKPNDAVRWLPETDTFDTWFSSAQWPVVTLKTNKPGDFDTFYPTSVMETGYDILPFWVMRMMLLGIYLTGKSPFHDVYLHGLVRDEKGQKMSKSKGNVINPLEIVSEYGADALRLALVIRSTPGQDKSVGAQDFKAMRNFTNKLWNAARYILTSPNDIGSAVEITQLPESAFKQKLTQVVIDITQQLKDYKLGMAAETAYNEFWHWFCDQCIEEAKEGKITDTELLTGLVTFLTVLHPFTPLVTETIWQELVKKQAVTQPRLITAVWPTI